MQKPTYTLQFYMQVKYQKQDPKKFIHWLDNHQESIYDHTLYISPILKTQWIRNISVYRLGHKGP